MKGPTMRYETIDLGVYGEVMQCVRCGATALGTSVGAVKHHQSCAPPPPLRVFDDADVTRLAEELRGTCRDLDETCETLLGMEWTPNATDADCDELDSVVFRCDACDWWCSNDEEAYEEDGVEPGAAPMCRDCAEATT